MRRVVLTLLLLAVLGLNLGAGAHPCQAAHGDAQAQGQPAASQPPPSCHEAMGHETQTAQTGPGGLSVREGTPSQGERSCCEIACPHACHLMAVVSFQPVTFPAALVSQNLVATAERDASPFTGGIDHIPLL